MDKSPIEIAIGQTNILIEDEVCKAVGKVGIHINKEELLKALKAYEFVEELTNYIFAYPDDDYMTMECLCRKLFKHGLVDKKDGEWTCNFVEQADTPQTEQPEPQTVDWGKRKPCTLELFDDDGNYIEPKTEPQTERSE